MREDLSAFLARERAAAIQWARELVNRPDWLILDTETTGLGPEAEVCQVGVILANGVPLVDMLVRPTIPIPADASAIHGITDSSVVLAATFPPVYRSLDEILTFRRVIVYNAAYDSRILEQSGDPYDLPPLIVNWECAMRQYARFIGQWNAYHGSFRWQKLPPIPGESAHSAIADCKATLALIHRMAEATL